jgi:hypothetical protein
MQGRTMSRVHFFSAEELMQSAFAGSGRRSLYLGSDADFAPEFCSVPAAIPALDAVATIVRGADTSRRDLAPECEGLYAISFGLSANFPDDHEMLSHGLVIYDALYTWCRKALVAAAEQPLKAQA